jgi:hypothetical protein
MSEESFHRVISEHLALAERNRRLERTMPLDGYREHHGRASAADHSSLPQSSHEEPSTELNIATPRRNQNSWWDTSEERPLPDFDRGDT